MQLKNLLLLALLSIGAATHARAQEGDTIRRISRSPVTVEALRTPLLLPRIPYTVTHSTPEPVSGLSFEEVFRRIPGLHVDNRFNFAVGDRLSLRGFGARTQFGVRGIKTVGDDIPLTFADGQSALEVLDPALVSSVEVLHGPASTQFGNAAGGVVILRAQPIANSSFGRVTTSGGSDGLFRSAPEVNFAGERFGANVLFSRFTYDGYRQYSAAHFYRASGKARYALGDRDVLRFSSAFVDFDAENPGALTSAEVEADPTKAAPMNVQRKAGKAGKQAQGGLFWSHLTDGGSIDLGVYAIRREIENPIVPRIISFGRDAFGFRANWNEKIAEAAQLIVGVDIDKMIDDRQNYANADGSKGALQLDQDESVLASGVYAQGLIAVAPALDVHAGLRFDNNGFAVVDNFTDSLDDSGSRTMSALSWSIGLVWRPVEEVAAFANVSTSFETPTTTELANRPNGVGGFNPELEPQRTLGIEVGSRFMLLPELSCAASIYRMLIRDELISFEVPSFAGRAFFRNAASAVHQGIEWSAIYATEALDVRASFNYIDARFDDYVVAGADMQSNRVPAVAPCRAALALGYRFVDALFATAEMRYVSAYFADDANKVSTPEYTLFDLTIGHPSIDIGAFSFDIRAGVQNLFDRRHVATVTQNVTTGRYFEPGAGRTFFGRIAIRLQ